VWKEGGESFAHERLLFMVNPALYSTMFVAFPPAPYSLITYDDENKCSTYWVPLAWNVLAPLLYRGWPSNQALGGEEYIMLPYRQAPML